MAKIRNGRWRDVYYLATPFSHPLPHIPYWRYIAAAEVLAELTREKVPAFSPIVHNYPVLLIAKTEGKKELLPPDFWYGFDVHYMRLCQAGIAVAQLPGWEASEGVAAEIEWFLQKGLPVLNLKRDWLEKTLRKKTLRTLDHGEELKSQEKT